MKHVKIKPILVAAAFVAAAGIFLQGCAKEHIPDPGVYFQEDILPLIVSNCTKSGCHNSIDREEGYDFTYYLGIRAAVIPGDYKGSVLYKSLVKPFGYMPEDGDRLPDEDIEAVALWIEQGALENSGSSGCETDNITFSSTVKGVLTDWCYSCHQGVNPVGVIRLETYAQVKFYVDNGKLLGTIRHDNGYLAMPDGGAKIPACDIEQIEKWVAEGALDN